MGIAQIYNSINELIGEPHRIELIDPISIKERLFGEDHDCKSGCPCGGQDDELELDMSDDGEGYDPEVESVRNDSAYDEYKDSACEHLNHE